MLVAGQDVPTLDRDALFALRRKIGMLFQFGALFTDMSVFENVAFPLREHTELPEELIRDLVLMKLNAVGLRGAAQLMPSELSGGMARRVALARAIALDPMLVMYDEPFAGLDPISLGVVGQLIRKLNDALGITSIVVTHDIYESLKIVDYIYFVSDGPDRRAGHARRGARVAPIRSCASSSTASPTVRCRSTIRRTALRRGVLRVRRVTRVTWALRARWASGTRRAAIERLGFAARFSVAVLGALAGGAAALPA